MIAGDLQWGYANGNILLPLSPKRALLFGVIEVQRKRMPELQFYIITQCRSAVYSHVSSTEFQRVLHSTKEGKAQSAMVPGA